ncbi:MAG TPA: trimethylamine methyltransferase family protein [Anaerovoracaceae bacterium]|nr:trimethylamine methyltransferase family protein [Anaerovoracaceae bacterium]
MSRLSIQVLTDAEKETIVNAALRVLERTGVKVCCEEALALLKNAGCSVEGDLVKIPADLVRSAVKTAPGCINIYNREGSLAMELTGTNSYYGPGVTCPYFFDPYTLERVPSTKQHVMNTAVVADALENVNFLMSLCMISDETASLADIHEVQAMIENSPKPLLCWSFDAENLADIAEMAEIAVGGKDRLKAKPYLMAYVEPTSPLMHSKEAMEKLIYLAKNDIPFVYSPGMLFGGTAPVTLAGAMTVGFADTLTGVVVSQLVKEGAPILISSNGGILDMNSLQAAYGSPEQILIEAAAAQILQYLGIPSFGLAGATDSKELDMQSATETALQIAFNTGVGSNLIHDFGMMDIGMTGSLHMMVYCNELVNFSKRLKAGIIVDEDHLAADAIHNVGPGGSFIAERHTFKYFKKETYFPEFGLRKGYSVWESDGKKKASDLVHEKVIKILQEHKPLPLDVEKKERIASVVNRAEARKKEDV